MIPHNVRKTLSDCKCVRQHGFGGFPSCSLATCAYRQPMIGNRSIGSVAKIGGSQREAVALRRSGGCCAMVVEHAHGLRTRRGANAKRSLHKAPLAPEAGPQTP